MSDKDGLQPQTLPPANPQDSTEQGLGSYGSSKG